MYLCYLVWLHGSLVNQDYLHSFFSVSNLVQIFLLETPIGQSKRQMVCFYWAIVSFLLSNSTLSLIILCLFFFVLQAICLTSVFRLFKFKNRQRVCNAWFSHKSTVSSLPQNDNTNERNLYARANLIFFFANRFFTWI